MIERNPDEYLFADAFIGCQQAKLMNWQDLVRLANLGDAWRIWATSMLHRLLCWSLATEIRQRPSKRET